MSRDTVGAPLRGKLLLLLLIGLFYSLSLAYFFQGLPRAKLTSDLFPRWYASRMLLTEGRSVYDWANAPEISEITGWPKLHNLGYYYPAYLLVLTVPLSLLPYEAAHFIWVVAGLWLMWSAMFIFARQVAPHMSLNRLTLLLVMFTTAVPVFQHTLYAQFNTIGLLALALSYRALCREKYWQAGLWAGGLLVKPQATLLPLAFFVAWSALRRRRWPFWPGLAGAGVGLWLVGELFERNWVFNLLASLQSYEPIESVIKIITGDPFYLPSLLLLAITAGLGWRIRDAAPTAPPFYGFLVWTMCMNALLIPMFGMLHIVLLGPMLVILLGAYQQYYPAAAPWLWRGTVALFIAGLLAFILPLLLTDTTSLQIVAAEAVYRFSLPLLMALAALPLMLRAAGDSANPDDEAQTESRPTAVVA